MRNKLFAFLAFWGLFTICNAQFTKTISTNVNEIEKLVSGSTTFYIGSTQVNQATIGKDPNTSNVYTSDIYRNYMVLDVSALTNKINLIYTITLSMDFSSKTDYSYNGGTFSVYLLDEAVTNITAPDEAAWNNLTGGTKLGDFTVASNSDNTTLSFELSSTANFWIKTKINNGSTKLYISMVNSSESTNGLWFWPPYKFTISFDPKKPSAPINLSYANSTCSNVTLKWDAVDYATSYNVYNGSAVIKTGNTSTSYSVTNLTANTSYTFYVTAVNSNGESAKSSGLTVTTKGYPVTPAGLASSNITCSGFKLSWTTATNATSYNVYMDGSTSPLASSYLYKLL